MIAELWKHSCIRVDVSTVTIWVGRAVSTNWIITSKHAFMQRRVCLIMVIGPVQLVLYDGRSKRRQLSMFNQLFNWLLLWILNNNNFFKSYLLQLLPRIWSTLKIPRKTMNKSYNKLQSKLIKKSKVSNRHPILSRHKLSPRLITPTPGTRPSIYEIALEKVEVHRFNLYLTTVEDALEFYFIEICEKEN